VWKGPGAWLSLIDIEDPSAHRVMGVPIAREQTESQVLKGHSCDREMEHKDVKEVVPVDSSSTEGLGGARQARKHISRSLENSLPPSFVLVTVYNSSGRVMVMADVMMLPG
jgi:hypothetical protein